MPIATSPWASYVRELDNIEVYETIEGFAFYKIKGDECYIQDIYVHPEYRESHSATKIADHIADLAKNSGCKYLTGSVRPNANNSTRSAQVLIGYGMRLHSSINNLIYFIKDL